jgi:putative lipase involved disintegration of autophagic bodies
MKKSSYDQELFHIAYLILQRDLNIPIVGFKAPNDLNLSKSTCLHLPSQNPIPRMAMLISAKVIAL